MVAGLKPQVGPTAFLRCIKMPLAFLHTFSMCSFHDSFESRMIPKNFVDVCTSSSSSMPSTLRGLLSYQFLLLVNMTQWVLRWLSLSPLFLHHRLILFRLFCDTSLKVLASYPYLPLVCLGAVTIVTSAKSFANPCRSLGILFLVYSSNSLTTRFHRKGERIPPCGQPLLIAMVLRSPCSSTVVCRLWIIDLIHWLTSADLHFESRALSIASKYTLSNAPSISRKVPSAIP